MIYRHIAAYKNERGYNMFENKRYITRGVSQKVDLPLQLFMWQCIDELDVPKDYLQVFKLSVADGKQKIDFTYRR